MRDFMRVWTERERAGEWAWAEMLKSVSLAKSRHVQAKRRIGKAEGTRREKKIEGIKETRDALHLVYPSIGVPRVAFHVLTPPCP